MVRIVNQQQERETVVKDLTSTTLNPKAMVLLEIIAIVIADNSKAIRELLEEYSLELPASLNDKELTDQLFNAICENDEEFNNDLARIILDCGLSTAYDGFDLSPFSFKGNEDYADEEGGSSGGNTAGIIGGITNALGGIAGAIGARRQAKEAATANTLQGIFNYRTQLASNEQSKRKTKVHMLIGLFALLGVALIALMLYQNKQRTLNPSPINA